VPNRLLRDGLLDSDRVNALSAEGERLFTRLLLVADDFGRFDGRVTVIRARCFPVKRDLTDGDVGRWLEEIARQKELVVFYRVGGKPYVEVVNHRFRTRAMRSKYPAPSEGELTDIGQSNDSQLTSAPLPSPSPSPSPADICPSPDGQTTGKRQSSDGQNVDVPRETSPEPLTLQAGGNGAEKPAPKVRTHRMDGWKAPTVEEVDAYAKAKGYTGAAGREAEKFVAHYDARSWKYPGGAPVKDWKKALFTWHLKEPEFRRAAGPQSQREEDAALLQRRKILTG